MGTPIVPKTEPICQNEIPQLLTPNCNYSSGFAAKTLETIHKTESEYKPHTSEEKERNQFEGVQADQVKKDATMPAFEFSEISSSSSKQVKKKKAHV